MLYCFATPFFAQGGSGEKQKLFTAIHRGDSQAWYSQPALGLPPPLLTAESPGCRVFPGRLLQGHDLERKDFRLVIAGDDFADDENGLVRQDQVAISLEILIHAEDLDRAFEVLECHQRVRFAGFFGDAILHRGDQTADARHATVGKLVERGRCVQAKSFDERREGRQRVAGDVKTEQLFFVGEQFVLRPFGQWLHRFRHR